MAEGQTCRVCGCSDYSACDGGCWWVPDPEGLGSLCSSCEPTVQWGDQALEAGSA